MNYKNMEIERFYKVRREDGLFYDPNKAGDRKEATFSREGKRYKRKKHALNAKEWLSHSRNDHWVPNIIKTPYDCVVCTFESQVQMVEIEN